MLTDIKIGQYFPATSFMHQMDARLKLVGLLVLLMGLFLFDTFYAYILWSAFIFLMMISSKIPLKLFFTSLKPMFWIILFTFVIHLFSGTGEVLYKIGFLSITYEGITRGIFICLRLTLLILASSILTFTTPPLTLSDAMEDLLSPFKKIGVPSHEIAMMMTIALRFIPTLLEETDKIIKAQKSRGADFNSGGIKKRIMAIMPILIPLFMGAFRRADDLALAMEARCYHGGIGRTRLKKLQFTKKDYLAIGILAVVISIAFILTYVI